MNVQLIKAANDSHLRFYLGWAQEVAGDHAAAQESWRQARSELEPLLKEQPGNYLLISALALSDVGLGDKAAALTLTENAMAGNPIEKDAVIGARPLEILARVAAQTGEPDRCHRRFPETALDSVLWPNDSLASAHSGAASARSNVRSAPERSALPKTRRLARVKVGTIGHAIARGSGTLLGTHASRVLTSASSRSQTFRVC